MDKKAIGRIGECQALNFLASQNYQIITNNYYSRFGEIDLITVDYSTHELAFIEVKTRTNNNFGEPQEAITRQKISRLLKTIFTYLQKHQNHQNHPLIWRLDLITVKLNKQYQLQEISHLKNILNGN